jgi:hypothetical protein
MGHIYYTARTSIESFMEADRQPGTITSEDDGHKRSKHCTNTVIIVKAIYKVWFLPQHLNAMISTYAGSPSTNQALNLFLCFRPVHLHVFGMISCWVSNRALDSCRRFEHIRRLWRKLGIPTRNIFVRK